MQSACDGQPTSSSECPAASSITHEHLMSVLNSERSRFRLGDEVNVLEVGCGNGKLLAYLVACMKRVDRHRQYAVYAFDVVDHAVQVDGFSDATLAELYRMEPSYPWKERVRFISVSDQWPFPDNFFHVILSNQVVEHIQDHDKFFAEVSRTLTSNGICVNLFPFKSYVYEGHLKLPFVHRIANYALMKAYIRTLSTLGFGKYCQHKREYGCSLEQYAEEHADYLNRLVHYVSYAECLRLCKNAGLRMSLKYTPGFYVRKMRQMLGLKRSYEYSNADSFWSNMSSLLFFRFLSCVTVCVEKKRSYRAFNEGSRP